MSQENTCGFDDIKVILAVALENWQLYNVLNTLLSYA